MESHRVAGGITPAEQQKKLNERERTAAGLQKVPKKKRYQENGRQEEGGTQRKFCGGNGGDGVCVCVICVWGEGVDK